MERAFSISICLVFFPSCLKCIKCRAMHMRPNPFYKSDWHHMHAALEEKLSDIGRDSFVCRLMLHFTGVVKVAKPLWTILPLFFELAVGGKFSVPLKRFCARLNSLILNIQATFFFAVSIKTLLLKQTQLARNKKKTAKKNLSTT